MADKGMKLLLLFAGLGLWANVISSVAAPAIAQSDRTFRTIESKLDRIESDLDRIQRGSCGNTKLC